MAPQEQSELVKHLEDGREDFREAVAGLSESEAKIRPDPERWSVLDCVEHVVTVEQRFIGFLGAAQKSETPRVNKQKETDILTNMPNRSTRFQAPEAVLPNGRFATLEEALAQFEAERARSIRFAEERREDLYCLSAKHQRLGELNGAEFLTLIAAHARRHANQIRETRAALKQ